VNRPSLARPLVGREVRCPTCKAAIGAACVVTRGRHAGGRLHGTHPARVRLARAMANKFLRYAAEKFIASGRRDLIKWVGLLVWHVEQPDGQTVCGLPTPAKGAAGVYRVRKPTDGMKVCRLCKAGKKMPGRAAPTSTGRW
jgi:hypothetical protein